MTTTEVGGRGLCYSACNCILMCCPQCWEQLDLCSCSHHNQCPVLAFSTFCLLVIGQYITLTETYLTSPFAAGSVLMMRTAGSTRNDQQRCEYCSATASQAGCTLLTFALRLKRLAVMLLRSP